MYKCSATITPTVPILYIKHISPGIFQKKRVRLLQKCLWLCISFKLFLNQNSDSIHKYECQETHSSYKLRISGSLYVTCSLTRCICFFIRHMYVNSLYLVLYTSHVLKLVVTGSLDVNCILTHCI